MAPRRFDVFISYNRADEAAVVGIAERLRQERLEPWLDRWSLMPGDSWQEEIVVGLRASKACAVVIGPQGLGDWAREELEVAQGLAAKDRTFRMFMVLLPGAPELSDPVLAFLRNRTWVDLRSGLDRNGFEELVSAITGVPRRQEVVVATADICPYPGLEAFDEEDARFFFGREDDVALVVEKVKASRFLAVLGPSGSGKSSLLRAGFVPAVRRCALPGSDTWSLRVFQPGPRPLTALAVQMTHLFADAPIHETLDRLHDDARSLDLAASVALTDGLPSDRVLLVVDQFEEVFTVCADEDERRAFLANLHYAATIPGGRVVVVVGMRADFYDRCAPYRDLRALVADQQFLVGPLDADGLRRAIEEPARSVGLALEPGLVDVLLNDVGAGDGRSPDPGSLPLLSHALLATWQRRKGDALTLPGYHDSGGVRQAVATTAEGVYEALGPAGQATARALLLRLVSFGDSAEETRRRIHRDELPSGPSSDGTDTVQTVLDALVQARLVVLGEDTIDIAHEALVRAWPRLAQWLADDREGLRTHRALTEAAQAWERLQRDPGALYRGAQLAVAQEWATREDNLRELNRVERDFLDASTALARRGTRRARQVAAALVLLLVAALVGSGVALQQRQEARRQRGVALQQRQVAISRQLAAQANTLLGSQLDVAALLSVEAFHVAPTEEAAANLRNLSIRPEYRVELPDRSPPALGLEFSPDGRLLASSHPDGVVQLWDLESKALLATLNSGDQPVHHLVFSPDGKLLAAASGRQNPFNRLYGSASEFDYRTESVVIWDVTRRSPVATLTDHPGHVTGMAFSPDEKILALSTGQVTVDQFGRSEAGFPTPGEVVDIQGAIDLWDVTTAARVTRIPGFKPPDLDRTDPFVGVAFSPDGRTLAGRTHYNNSVILWDAGGHNRLGELRPTLDRDKSLTGMGFSDDSRTLVLLSDATAMVWSVDHRVQIATLNEPTTILGGWSSDDGHRQWLITSETIAEWDVPGRTRQVRVTRGTTFPFYRVGVAPDAGTLASTWSVDGAHLIALGNLDPRRASAQICAKVRRSLTPEEWRQYVPDLPYRRSCPE
ncbi:MAG: TIR domain-containing protein [Actinobacteria bacterium]|nr:TIR domain-containing protein [Actinomycetota bacterium]